MIHVHGDNMTLAEVRAVPLVRPPGAGGYWAGIKHGDLVDGILNECKKRKWKILDTKFAVSGDGAALVGAFDVAVPGVKTPADLTLGLGVIHANTRKCRARLVCGATVSVCTNGLVIGEVLMKRKHTINMDLDYELDAALDQYVVRAKRIGKDVDELRINIAAHYSSDRYLMEAARRKLMPWSRIGDVDREYHKPTYPEFQGDTAWGLLNAFSMIAKRNPPLKQMLQIKGFYELLTEYRHDL